MHSFLHDTPFPKVLGEISQKRLSGRLRLQWVDLCRTIHFKNGNIIAILSNQESESISAAGEIKDQVGLALRILQELFCWELGESVFEEGEFPGRPGLHISTGELVYKGIKNWTGGDTVKRRVMDGGSIIQLNPNFQETLLQMQLAPGDVFLLFRFDKEISFRELLALSGIPEEEFFRLIYLFQCLAIIKVQPERILPMADTPHAQEGNLELEFHGGTK